MLSQFPYFLLLPLLWNFCITRALLSKIIYLLAVLLSAQAKTSVVSAENNYFATKYHIRRPPTKKVDLVHALRWRQLLLAQRARFRSRRCPYHGQLLEEPCTLNGLRAPTLHGCVRVGLHWPIMADSRVQIVPIRLLSRSSDVSA